MGLNSWKETLENVCLMIMFSTNWLPHLASLTFITIATLLIFTRFYWITLAYAIFYFYDMKTPTRGGRFSEFIRTLRLWKMLENYYPARVYKTVDLDPRGNYMFAMQPHGHFMCLTGNGDTFARLFPGLTIHWLTVDSFFKWPILRDWLLALGCGSVSAESIEYKLTKLGPGHSVGIAVGGRQEMYFANTGHYHLRIMKRKGFIRLALRTGVPIIPIFCYGITDGYELAPPLKEGSFWEWFFRTIDIPNITGRFGIFVPKQKPINSIVGKPIKFDREALERIHGSGNEAAIVDACHQIYLDELRKLFDENKARFNDERQLIYI